MNKLSTALIIGTVFLISTKAFSAVATIDCGKTFGPTVNFPTCPAKDLACFRQTCQKPGGGTFIENPSKSTPSCLFLTAGVTCTDAKKECASPTGKVYTAYFVHGGGYLRGDCKCPEGHAFDAGGKCVVATVSAGPVTISCGKTLNSGANFLGCAAGNLSCFKTNCQKSKAGTFIENPSKTNPSCLFLTSGATCADAKSQCSKPSGKINGTSFVHNGGYIRGECKCAMGGSAPDAAGKCAERPPVINM